MELSKNASILGEKLKEIRLANNLKVEDAAKNAGISRNTLYNYENGSKSPTIEILRTLLDVYHTSFHDFIEADYTELKKDLAVFKRYGLSEGFFFELYMHQICEGDNRLSECINMLFDYPLEGSLFFEKLQNYFDVQYHNAVESSLSSLLLPLDSSKRLLLEPIVDSLIQMFNRKYPKQNLNKVMLALNRVAQERKGMQEEYMKLKKERIADKERLRDLEDIIDKKRRGNP